MGDLIFFIIKLALFVLGIYLIYRVAQMIKKLIELVGQKKKADELRNKFDVFSVESEVLSFSEKRISRFDTQYDVHVCYEVDGITYYKDLTIFNRGSLRVGRMIILLCDNDDHQNVIVQNGDEEEAIQKLVWNLVFMAFILVIEAMGFSQDVLDLTESISSLFGG